MPERDASLIAIADAVNAGWAVTIKPRKDRGVQLTLSSGGDRNAMTARCIGPFDAMDMLRGWVRRGLVPGVKDQSHLAARPSKSEGQQL